MSSAAFLRSSRTLPLVTGFAVIATAATAYALNSRPLLLDSAHNAPTKALTLPSGMLFGQRLIVSKNEQINHDTARITLQLPRGEEQISGVPAGSAILTQHTPEGKWLPVHRPYTPIGGADERGVVELLVKRYPNGRASTYMHSLVAGQTLLVRGPIPGYSWTPATTAPQDILLVAGGAGITPIYSLANGILHDNTDKTRIQLLWGVNGTRDLILRNELEALEKQFPDRLQVTYCVSGPESQADISSLGDKSKFRKGYVDRAVLQLAIQRCEQGNWGDGRGTKVMLCGPPAMESALASRNGVLAELGVAPKNVHKF